MTRDEIYRQLVRAFRRYCGVPSSGTQSLVPATISAGKMYEAHVLSLIVEKLVTREGYSLILAGGNKLQLKSAPGLINRTYPRIELRRSGVCVAELWTDVEFLSLSHASCRSVTLTKGDYHELDLIIVGPGQQGARDTIPYGLAWNARTPATRRGCLKRFLVSAAKSACWLTTDQRGIVGSSRSRPGPVCLVDRR